MDSEKICPVCNRDLSHACSLLDVHSPNHDTMVLHLMMHRKDMEMSIYNWLEDNKENLPDEIRALFGKIENIESMIQKRMEGEQ